MSADDDDITEELLADAGKLTGLSLELLGLDPHPDDMTAEQRLQFDPEDLAEMADVSPVDRHKAVGQTRLLAGLLWNSSSILIDQLFRDLGTLSRLDLVTPADIAGTSVLSSLPPQFAAGYDAKFTQDIYELDLPEDWRAAVEEVLLEDAESDALYADDAGPNDGGPDADGGKLGFEHWFRPF